MSFIRLEMVNGEHAIINTDWITHIREKSDEKPYEGTYCQVYMHHGSAVYWLGINKDLDEMTRLLKSARSFNKELKTF